MKVVAAAPVIKAVVDVVGALVMAAQVLGTQSAPITTVKAVFLTGVTLAADEFCQQ